MMAHIKSGPSGARIYGLRTEMAVAFTVACFTYMDAGAGMCTLTSGSEGKHSAGSLHYAGLAIDLRPPETNRDKILVNLRLRLGDEFDVVDEGNHFHIEYQPKVGVNNG